MTCVCVCVHAKWYRNICIADNSQKKIWCGRCDGRCVWKIQTAQRIEFTQSHKIEIKIFANAICIATIAHTTVDYFVENPLNDRLNKLNDDLLKFVC